MILSAIWGATTAVVFSVAALRALLAGLAAARVLPRICWRAAPPRLGRPRPVRGFAWMIFEREFR